ncbi:hypothetical protein [Desulfovibrio sp.]|uniref:hypothetical protein n=1 Tax=Desulfovibrio sp. TaxID=885 RepID=UPI003D0AC84E
MSELNNNIETISAVLDILQNNALPSQKPVLRLLGDHLRLLARCMDDAALCPPHLPSGTPTPDTSRLVAYPPVTDTSYRQDNSSLRPDSSHMVDSSHMPDSSHMVDSSRRPVTDGTARRVQEAHHVRQ